MAARAAVENGGVWFTDGEEHVRAKDLSQEELAEWFSTTGVEAVSEVVGRQVVAVVTGSVGGAYGREPCTWLVFEDGKSQGFVSPAGEGDFVPEADDLGYVGEFVD